MTDSYLPFRLDQGGEAMPVPAPDDLFALTETGYRGLVHGDACPDNVRFLDGRCRIFDFEHSGWGAVALDAS